MMKAVLLVVLSLVFLSQAQPKISETFSSDIDVERHTRGVTSFGNGVIARDPTSKTGIEYYNITLADSKDEEIVYRLERYDLNPPMEYHIRGTSNDPHLHCNTEDVENPEIQPFFGWVEYAKDMGEKEIEHLKVHAWAAEFGGTKLELGVDPDDSTKPLILLRETAGEQVLISFKSFNTTVVAKEFEVPKLCIGPSTIKQWSTDKPLFGGDN